MKSALQCVLPFFDIFNCFGLQTIKGVKREAITSARLRAENIVEEVTNQVRQKENGTNSI
jgi:hypothetical protein